MVPRANSAAIARRIENISEGERANGAARLTLLVKVYSLAETIGKRAAVREMVRLAKQRELPKEMQDLLNVANARAGKQGRTLSESTLLAWMRRDNPALLWNERIVLLAEKRRGKNLIPADDVIEVLAMVRQANKQNLAWCVKQVAAKRGLSFSSLEHRCRRAKENLPNSLFYPGCHTGPALKALQPFRRREFLSLKPNDVWVGDGHGMKMKVAHPITGNPFVPEVTAILDVSDRFCVGWSVSLSENRLAVSDALRHAVSQHGIPLVYYSDNGAGQKNKMFDAPITGTLGALGIEHDTGRPNNPQGRGVIERFWPTVMTPLAKRFDTYRGRDADRDTLKKVTKEIDKALRAAKRGEVTALPARLPTWAQFLEALEGAVNDYNKSHQHSSLPKIDGTQHPTPAEYRAARIVQTGVVPHRPQPAELATMFMPSELRKVQRGEVRIFNGIYFHRDLMLIDGENAQVCFDIHDASRVWVKRLPGGELIAEAELGGNSSRYMPETYVEGLRQKRAKRRLGLLQSKVDEVQAELDGNTIPAPIEAISKKDDAMAALEAKLASPKKRAEFHQLGSEEKYARWAELDAQRAAGEVLSEADQQIWTAYQQSGYFRVKQKFEGDFERMLEERQQKAG